MDYEAAQQFKPYLAPKESVRWSGRPAQGVVFRQSDMLFVPFSLIWCGFVIFWESLAVTSGEAFMMIWGVPFIAVGLYMVAGRFFYEAFVRSRTYYALTQNNALVLGGFDGKKLTTVDLKALQELHLKQRNDGRGTIVFGPDTMSLVRLRTAMPRQLRRSSSALKARPTSTRKFSSSGAQLHDARNLDGLVSSLRVR
jgi:hypothetical protein